jgi:periplasmic divalent cation tolerance protein
VSDVFVVLVTAPNIGAASGLARALVDERLAACVGILPSITSVFRWEGQTKTATENQLVIKTSAGRVEELVARVKALHPYDVPEILALPVAAGLPAYLQWVVAETTKPA